MADRKKKYVDGCLFLSRVIENDGDESTCLG